MKTLSEQVWPVENYTDKVHFAVKSQMKHFAHLAFTVVQLRPYVQSGYPWLKTLNERQTALLDQLIKTGLTKFVQLGMIKKVSSKVQVDPQWQWASSVAESGYTDMTNFDSVAQTEEGKKLISRRAIGGRSLWKLNQKAKLGMLH